MSCLKEGSVSARRSRPILQMGRIEQRREIVGNAGTEALEDAESVKPRSG